MAAATGTAGPLSCGFCGKSSLRERAERFLDTECDAGRVGFDICDFHLYISCVNCRKKISEECYISISAELDTVQNFERVDDPFGIWSAIKERCYLGKEDIKDVYKAARPGEVRKFLKCCILCEDCPLPVPPRRVPVGVRDAHADLDPPVHLVFNIVTLSKSLDGTDGLSEPRCWEVIHQWPRVRAEECKGFFKGLVGSQEELGGVHLLILPHPACVRLGSSL